MGFGNLGAQNAVFCLVIGCKIVVNVWWKALLKIAWKNAPHFEDLFWSDL